MFTCQPALQEELGIKNHGTVELAWTILGINRASGVLKPQGKIWNHHRFHSDQGCKKTIPGAGSCPSANPPGQSGTKWTQDKQLGSFSKHFFYCNNSSINFRLQDSELQALCGTRSRLKSQDLLCTTGINTSTRHIILTIKYCRPIPAPQWSCSSFASHHPTPIPLEPVNSYLKNPKRMVWHLKRQHFPRECQTTQRKTNDLGHHLQAAVISRKAIPLKLPIFGPHFPFVWL